jgi:hypothetical protein
MTQDNLQPSSSQDATVPPPKKLTPQAQRALAEAAARRKAYLEQEAALPKEVGGRGGNEPVRYGDWEIKGLASDF